MLEVKAHQGDRFVRNPPAAIRLFLVYGTDAGTVTERAAALVEGALAADPGRSVVRIAAEELTADPGRLSDEANAGSLFGGDPVIRIAMPDARANLAPAVRPLVEGPPDRALIIVEAGDLKKSNPLRALLKDAPHAAEVSCYETSPQDIAALAREIAGQTGNRFAPEALEQLSHSLGADRLVARREIEKLCLYAGGAKQITADDVEAVLGESVALVVEQLIDDVMLGQIERVESTLMRCRSEQTSFAGLAARGLRMLIDLQAMRLAVDAGRPLPQVIAGARPPVFFKRRAAVESILKRWSSEALGRTCSELQEAMAVSRVRADLESAVISNALLLVARRP